MGLRVLERNLNFSERKLEGRLWRRKARLDAQFAKSTMNGAYGCTIRSGKIVLHRGVQTRHLDSKQAATTLGSLGQFEVGAKPASWKLLPTSDPTFRGGNGSVGIIRSPIRAIALPDNRHEAENAKLSRERSSGPLGPEFALGIVRYTAKRK